jgi:hypothetical protein
MTKGVSRIKTKDKAAEIRKRREAAVPKIISTLLNSPAAISSAVNLGIAGGNPIVVKTRTVIYKGKTILKMPIPSGLMRRIIII